MWWMTVACETPEFPITVTPAAADPSEYVVTGTAAVEAAPDCADLRATLSVEAARPAEATARLRERQQALLVALTGAEVSVSPVSLRPVVETVDARTGRTRVRGYEAAVALTVTTHDFDALPVLLEAAASHGATQVSAAFRTSDLESLRTEARRRAAADARARATAVAAALGVPLGKVKRIRDDAPAPPGSYTAGPGAGVRAEGEVITAAVTVTYDLP
ncbi:MAG: SIMPL domain-containing protein [Myxococcota bacterium]